jgi:hypothetical protein
MIPEFVYSKASASACVKSERFQMRDGQPLRFKCSLDFQNVASSSGGS